MAILRLFPHNDIHLALNTPGANSIPFRLFKYTGTGPFGLDPLDNAAEWTAQVLAPHNAVGSRLQSFATVDFAARTITATGLGTNLIVLHHQSGTENDYLVIRVQVHDRMLGWWFGNRSITTPVDTQFANAQPTIYAMFSDDAAAGTDRVGDITGHGFVTLTSSAPATFVVDNTNNAGRLRGVAAGNATLNGSFLALNASVPVTVVDLDQPRNILKPVRAGDLAKATERHNILFLSEGFTAADEAAFDRMVAEITDQLFSKPRHQPYGVLAESFNVFSAFTPSTDRLVTCCFTVTDTAVPSLSKGSPIPYEWQVGGDRDKYELAELVARVGLPRRGETRNMGDLVTLWNSQGLHDFNSAMVSTSLVAAWKACQNFGYLEARDTFFGMKLGGRRADLRSQSAPPIATPAADDGSANLKALVRRAYEFFRVSPPARSVDFDSRKHAPERMLSGQANTGSKFISFLNSLRMATPPNQALGSEWVPANTFKRSRGLIAIVMNEPMNGGTNLNNNSVTAASVNAYSVLTVSYVPNANPNIKLMRREDPTKVTLDLSGLIDTVAHEFGHSFNLGDEYEISPEPPNFAAERLNPADSRPNFFDTDDNLASLEAVFNDPNYITSGSREIDPAKFKWFGLPRIRLSVRMTAATQMSGAKIVVTVPPVEAAAWEAIKTSGEEVHMRMPEFGPTGQQLPLSSADTHHLTGLKVDSVDAAAGRITLESTTPINPAPAFPEGSYVFLPHRDTGGVVQSIIEPKVLAQLTASHKPLNSDIDKPDATSKINRGADFPRDIPDFKPPCQSSRLLGAYEGGGTWAGLIYRPSGTCKMRTSSGGDEHGEFCHVCKWLITNRVDPGKHHIVDSRFYPKAKKNE